MNKFKNYECNSVVKAKFFINGDLSVRQCVITAKVSFNCYKVIFNEGTAVIKAEEVCVEDKLTGKDICVTVFDALPNSIHLVKSKKVVKVPLVTAKLMDALKDKCIVICKGCLEEEADAIAASNIM